MSTDNKTFDLSVINNFEMKLDKNDLVQVLVAEYEAQLCLKRKGFENRRKELKKEITANNKMKNEIVQQHGNDQIAEKFAKLQEAFAFVNPDVKIKLNVDNRRDQTIYVAISMEGRGCSRLHEEIYDWPQEAKSLEAQNDELRVDVEKLDNELYEVRRKLSNLATMERQAKAQVARAALDKSEEGKQLLALIKDRDLKQLDLL